MFENLLIWINVLINSFSMNLFCCSIEVFHTYLTKSTFKLIQSAEFSYQCQRRLVPKCEPKIMRAGFSCPFAALSLFSHVQEEMLMLT